MPTTRPLALVAEDTELGRWAIAHALQADGFDTCVFDGWAESAGWLGRRKFDVVVVALSVDRDDVGNIAEHMRSHHRGTRLIVLAPQDEMGEVRSACGPGPVVLPKPLDVERIVQTAKSLTGRGPTTVDAQG